MLGHRGWPRPAPPESTLARVGGQVHSERSSRWPAVRDVRLPGGCGVPRLVEVLDLVAGRGQVVLDLKPEPRTGAFPRACLAAVRLARLPEDDIVLASFEPLLLDVLAVRPRLARAAVLDVADPVEPALVRARRRGDAAVHLPLRCVLAEPYAVREAAATGLAVRVWTVDRLVDAQLCALLGVSAVISDQPAALAAGLAAPAAA